MIPVLFAAVDFLVAFFFLNKDGICLIFQYCFVVMCHKVFSNKSDKGVMVRK